MELPAAIQRTVWETPKVVVLWNKFDNGLVKWYVPAHSQRWVVLTKEEHLEFKGEVKSTNREVC